VVVVRIVLQTKLVALLLAPANPESVPSNADVFAPVEIEVAPVRPDDEPAGVGIRGVLMHARRHEPIAGARVVLDCACLGQSRELLTDANGHYELVDLPEGTYTVTVYGERGHLTKVLDMAANATFVANFSIDPDSDLSGWTPVFVPRPIFTSAPEATAVPAERETCDRACRKARRAERRSARAQDGRRRRPQKTCQCYRTSRACRWAR
jgi:hypothetical protein